MTLVYFLRYFRLCSVDADRSIKRQTIMNQPLSFLANALFMGRTMMAPRLITAAVLVLTASVMNGEAQEPASAPKFKSSVDIEGCRSPRV